MVQPLRSPVPAPDATRDAAIFFTWMGLCVVLFVAGGYAARRHNELAGFLLVPILCVALFYENLTIAVNALAPTGEVAIGMEKLRGAVQSFVIPLFLVTEFELNYEVHKRRSANFFGCITFDQGHRTSTGIFGKLVRYSMWLLALLILLVQIVVNAPDMTVPGAFMPATTRFTSKDLGIFRTAGGAIDWSDVVDFFPEVILIAFSFYSGVSLWRYGTTISTDVRSTAVNPWMSLFVATIGVTLAWVLSPATWALPYAANAMEIVLLGSMVTILVLVDLNLRTLEDWEEVLGAANEAVIAIMAGRAKEREILGNQRAQRARRRAAAHGPQRESNGAGEAAAAAGGAATEGRGGGGFRYSSNYGSAGSGRSAETGLRGPEDSSCSEGSSDAGPSASGGAYSSSSSNQRVPVDDTGVDVGGGASGGGGSPLSGYPALTASAAALALQRQEAQRGPPGPGTLAPNPGAPLVVSRRRDAAPSSRREAAAQIEMPPLHQRGPGSVGDGGAASADFMRMAEPVPPPEASPSPSSAAAAARRLADSRASSHGNAGASSGNMRALLSTSTSSSVAAIAVTARGTNDGPPLLAVPESRYSQPTASSMPHHPTPGIGTDSRRSSGDKEATGTLITHVIGSARAVSSSSALPLSAGTAPFVSAQSSPKAGAGLPAAPTDWEHSGASGAMPGAQPLWAQSTKARGPGTKSRGAGGLGAVHSSSRDPTAAAASVGVSGGAASPRTHNAAAEADHDQHDAPSTFEFARPAVASAGAAGQQRKPPLVAIDPKMRGSLAGYRSSAVRLPGAGAGGASQYSSPAGGTPRASSAAPSAGDL